MPAPVALAPFDRLRVREPHLVNESWATAGPEPTVTVKLRVGFAGLRELENVQVWIDGLGEGEGDGEGDGDGVGDWLGDGVGVAVAIPTGAVSAETAVTEPMPLATVTAT